MSAISRIVIYLIVLGLSAILGVAAMFFHARVGMALTSNGWAPGACDNGCSQANWALLVASPFVTAIAGSAGLFTPLRRQALLAILVGFAGFAVATQWPNYPVQYILVLVGFSGIAYLIGDRGQTLIRD